MVLGGGGGIEDLERKGEQQEGKEDGIGGEPALQISRGVFFGEKRNLFFDRLNSGTGAPPFVQGNKGGSFRRSGPGPFLIVGGFSRLGGITHSYLIDCTTRENNLAFVGHVPQAPATEAAFMFNKVGALFGRQRRRVRNGTSDFTSIVIAAAEVVSLGRLDFLSQVVDFQAADCQSPWRRKTAWEGCRVGQGRGQRG